MSADNAAEAAHGGTERRRGLTRIDLRRLGRAALLGSSSRDGIPDAIEHIAKVHRGHHPRADLDALRRAYVLAESSHRGQYRKSGEPYITHPLAVTLILAELAAETTTLTAALLHDTVEDTEVTLEQVGREFGEEVRYLVDGVTKLAKVDYGAAAEPETFRKMLVATGNDVRVMSIKLADRLHNMRTLGVMRPEKQARIAKVTGDVLIPLAERLGVQALKTELEDLVFEILHPEDYAAARELITRHTAAPDPLAHVAEEVRAVLREAGIAADVAIRPRHVLSVHRARLKRGGRLGGSDFGRLLVLVAENADCYAVLGELHTCFTPVVAEFKDFIAAPKFNLYQSLHTAIADRGGDITEVLVRTRQMHQVAEAGVIALGNPYAHPAPPAGSQPGPTATATAAADDGEPAAEHTDPTRPGWLSRLLDWQRDAADPDTFWSALRDELAEDREITVLADGGGTIGLPAGATCIDAVYARYAEAGHACVGARVNGRLVPLGTGLRDGDTVQLLMATGEASGPSPQWLDHARTPAARIAIKRWLARRAESAEQAGPEPSPASRAPRAPAASAARTASPSPAPAARRPHARNPPHPDPLRHPSGAEPIAITDELPGAAVRLARCCTPVPPDEITGFVIRGGTVAVHRSQCAAVARMTAAGRAARAVRWHGGRPAAGYRVTVRAEALGRPHLLADLTEAIAAEGVGILAAAVEPPQEQRVRHTYTVELPEAGALPQLMRAMRRVPGVYDVYRTQHPVPAPS